MSTRDRVCLGDIRVNTLYKGDRDNNNNNNNNTLGPVLNETRRYQKSVFSGNIVQFFWYKYQPFIKRQNPTEEIFWYLYGSIIDGIHSRGVSSSRDRRSNNSSWSGSSSSSSSSSSSCGILVRWVVQLCFRTKRIWLMATDCNFVIKVSFLVWLDLLYFIFVTVRGILWFFFLEYGTSPMVINCMFFYTIFYCLRSK